MGIFQALFGPKGFSALVAKGDKERARGRLALARNHYAAALSAFDANRDPPLARTAAEAVLRAVTADLIEEHLTEARSFRDAGLFAEAGAEYAAALAILDPPAGDGEGADTKRAEAVRAEAQALAHRAAADDDGPATDLPLAGDLDDPDDGGAGALDDAFERLLHTLPEGRARAYRALGADFAVGCVRLHEGHAADAVTHLEKALAERPDSPLVHLELGRARLFEGDGAAAVSHLTAYCDAAPDDALGVFLVAEALRLAGRPDDAAGRLKGLCERRPDSARAHMSLAEHHLIEGAFDDAIAAANRALAILDPGPTTRRATSWSRAGSAEGAVRASAQGAGVEDPTPPRVALLRLLGQALVGAGRRDQAVEPLETAVKEHWRYDPENETLTFDRESAFLLATTYVDLGRRLGRAEELALALLKDAPDGERPAHLLLLSRVFAAQNNQAGAAAARDEAAELLAALGQTEAADAVRRGESPAPGTGGASA